MASHYKILLVEDDKIDQMAFERFVRSEKLPYEYHIASSVADALKLLETEAFDLALMDYSLGDGTSLELFPAAQHLPIIIITGSNDLDTAVGLMKAGAYDLLVKDTQGNYLITLPVTVKNAIERWRDQQELNQYRENLEKALVERTAAWLEGDLHLQAIVDATPTIVFSLDTAANFTYIYGDTEDILGQAVNGLIGQALSLIFPEQSLVKESLQRLLPGETFLADLEANGRWLSINLSPRVENKLVTGFIGVVHDISKRKQAELKLIQEHNLLRTLLDNIPDYVFIKDRDGRFIETNQAHAAGANISREEMLNRTAIEVFDPSIAEQFHTDDNYVMTTGKSIVNEERITTGADGSKRWVLTTKIPLFDEDKKTTIGLIGISRDVTERRQAEEERLQIERTRIEIENQRELLELKQRFIATASHDFRTPLSIIKMSANGLESYYERLSPETRARKFNQIYMQIDLMTNLLDDVLIVSKFNAGKQDFAPIDFQLKTFCERIWEDMLEVDQQNHQCHFEFLASNETIKAEEHRLQQVLVNMLSNAFKYTPAGGSVYFQVTNDERFINFIIRDTGYGIPLADQRHLFEPFYRASNVKNIQGTGLGLMIVKAYIDLHNGKISVQSEEGIGTSFTVQLPFIQEVPKE
jgi:PAS domain S-box-containing protein